MNECDQLTKKFKEPLIRFLELLISFIVIALGGVAFVQIMTPNESSPLYQLGDFLRFGLFVIALFLIMFFIANPLFKILKIKFIEQ